MLNHQFSYDANGLLKVEGTIVSTNEKAEISIDMTGVSGNGRIDVSHWADAKNSKKYRSVIKKGEKLVEKVIFDEFEKEDLEELIYELKKALITNRDDDKILKKLFKAEIDNDFIAENLAHVYMKNYDFGKASKIYESLYLKHPDNIVYLVCVARAYKANGWFKKAMPYYETIYKLDPDCVENAIELAECNSLSKKYDLARYLLIQVLERNKDKKNVDKNNFSNLFKVLFVTDAKNKYKYFNRDYETFLSFLTEDNKNLEIFRDSMFEVLNIFLEYKHFEMIKNLLGFIENCGIKLKEEEILHIKNVRLLVENQKIDMDNRIKKEVKGFISTYSAITINNVIPNNLDIYDDESIEMVSIIDKIMVLENVPEIEKQFDIIETDYPCCKELIKDFIDEVKSTKNKGYLLKKYKDKHEKKYKSSYEICHNIFKQELDDYSLYDLDYDAYDFENEELFDTQEPYRREEPKIGRNDPCPCGSGKKYKKCCGK